MSTNWTERRVVITGLGVVSSLGQRVDAFWDNIVAGKCGIQKITSFDPSAFDCQIAAQINEFDPVPDFPSPKEVRRTDRFTQFAISAANRALADSGLDLNKADRDQIGAYIGSGIGGLETTEEQHK